MKRIDFKVLESFQGIIRETEDPISGSLYAKSLINDVGISSSLSRDCQWFCAEKVPWNNAISLELTYFGPLQWQAEQTVSAFNASRAGSTFALAKYRQFTVWDSGPVI